MKLIRFLKYRYHKWLRDKELKRNIKKQVKAFKEDLEKSTERFEGV